MNKKLIIPQCGFSDSALRKNPKAVTEHDLQNLICLNHYSFNWNSASTFRISANTKAAIFVVPRYESTSDTYIPYSFSNLEDRFSNRYNLLEITGAKGLFFKFDATFADTNVCYGLQILTSEWNRIYFSQYTKPNATTYVDLKDKDIPDGAGVFLCPYIGTTGSTLQDDFTPENTGINIRLLY